MRRGRRTVLQGVTGLLGVGAVVNRTGGRDATPRRDDGAARNDRRQQTATETPTETATATETDTPTDPAETPEQDRRTVEPRNRPLAIRAERVTAEIDWFARKYPAAMESFRQTMRRGAKRTRAFREQEAITVPEAETLQTFFDGIVEDVQETLAPHFRIHTAIRRRTETHTATVRRFARRNDQDRVDEELTLLAQYAATRGQETYTDERLPRVPIFNRLVGQLTADPFENSDQPLLFRIYQGSTGFRSYVYDLPNSGRYQLFAPGYDNTIVRDYDAMYAPHHAPQDRVDRFYISPILGNPQLARPFGSRAPMPRREDVVYLQAYPDAQTAQAAYDRVLDRDAVRLDQFRTRPYPLGDSQWERTFYQYEGDTLYTVFTRAGRFLLVTGPSRTAWEERVDWDRVLRRSFLAGP